MENYTDSRDVIKTCIHPSDAVFDYFLNAGYSFHHWHAEDDEQAAMEDADLIIIVRKGTKEVANANFRIDNNRTAHCENVFVKPDHRGKRTGHRMANAIYVLAEKILGRTLTDFWTTDPNQLKTAMEDQSVDAKRLWSQKNRPFGPPT